MPGGGGCELGGNDGRLECGSAGQIASSRCLSCMYSSIKLSNFVSMSSAWFCGVELGRKELTERKLLVGKQISKYHSNDSRSGCVLRAAEVRQNNLSGGNNSVKKVLNGIV